MTCVLYRGVDCKKAFGLQGENVSNNIVYLLENAILSNNYAGNSMFNDEGIKNGFESQFIKFAKIVQSGNLTSHGYEATFYMPAIT